MNGYMNKTIFTRILGHDEIEQGHYWVDTNQCWICQGWNLIEIKFHPIEDRALFTKNLDRIEMLQSTVQNAVMQAMQNEGIFDEYVDLEDMENITEEGTDESKISENLLDKINVGGQVVEQFDDIKSLQTEDAEEN